ncbi:alpha/beta fold hydrolase [Spiractinospora alimapuensis]|uniref:alpha/beta fold hydrolase n=1 Tax=Spiractinospora alimapuensis TaxID=2820884 RepID=UPI001F18351D|nr:alpha/beta hydrolase [Spiractinospora alimapuensis]QVQ50920.1 alpha/beta fold hydrolase [Spiractinospora alimapuensis]
MPDRSRSPYRSERTTRWRRRGAVIAMMAFSAAGISVPAWSDSGPDTERPAHECADATEECVGVIEVPKDWNDPEGDTIEVPFAFVPASGEGEARGTILANEGGPFAQLVGVESVTEVLGPVLEERNLLMVEMRGFGDAAPLDCGEYDILVPDSIAECAEELAEDAPYFTMAQAVHDHDAVRSALGIDTLTLFGNSYGTMVMQSYISHYPQRVDAMMLDGVLNITDDGYTDTLNRFLHQQAALEGLAEVCSFSDACDDLPGEPADRLTEVVEQLREEGATEDLFTLSAPVINSQNMPDLGRETNAALAARLDGDPAPLQRTLVEYAIPEGSMDRAPDPAFLSYNCSDGEFPFDRDASREERRAQLDDFYETEQPFAPFTVEETIVGQLGVSEADWCVNWPAGDGPPVDVQADVPDVPVLITSGGRDTGTPTSGARRTAERFPGATLIVMPYEGHGNVYPSGIEELDCPTHQARDFLSDPETPAADHGCDDPPYLAQGAFPETVSDLGDLDVADLSGQEARAVHVSFATASDAAVRRHPAAWRALELAETTGIRGGEITFDDDTATIGLDSVRYVEDAAATGEVSHTPTGDVDADITLDTGDATHEVTLSWSQMFAGETTDVSGSIDGTPFTATIPAP